MVSLALPTPIRFTRANLFDAFLHYAYGAAFYGFALALYRTLPFYREFLLPESQRAFLALFVAYLVVAFPYFLLKRDRSLREHRERLALVGALRVACRAPGAFVRFAHGEPFRIPGLAPREKIAVLFAAVKFFFLPLMMNFMLVNGQAMFVQSRRLAALPSDSAADWIAVGNGIVYPLALAFIFFVDTLWFTFGYLIESPRLGNVVKSVEPTMLGWSVALISYPPFNAIAGTLFPWYANDYAYFGSDIATFVARLTIIVLFAIYLWATLSLGAKCGNLVNRGIVARGAYGIVRHPAYTTKVLSWWIMLLPAMSLPGLGLPAFTGMGAWTIIYYLRAVTEERHLSADPAYRAYRAKVRYRFIPRLW